MQPYQRVIYTAVYVSAAHWAAGLAIIGNFQMDLFEFFEGKHTINIISIYYSTNMTQILSLPTEYSETYLNFDRVFPLIDSKLQALISQVNDQKMTKEEHNFLDHSMNLRDAIARNLFEEFKQTFQTAVENKIYNNIQNLDQAQRVDICLGCTQFIDSLYMRYGYQGIQVLVNEYNYHGRLNPGLSYRTLKTLKPKRPLIISQPFYHGTTHEQMQEILHRCLGLDIPVHIDGAWITACKNIVVDFAHPAVHSFAVSMSKGYGLSGWNRIGLRWTKNSDEDAITVMNDYVQIPAENVAVGLYFLKNVPSGYLWAAHERHYNQICQDFNLTPTNSIHLAMRDEHPVGVEALLRWLEVNG
jgi:hypothetical protein